MSWCDPGVVSKRLPDQKCDSSRRGTKLS